MPIAKACRVLLCLVIAGPAFAQGIPIKGGATSDLANVDTNKNMRVAIGPSVRPTYTATISGATTASAAWNLQVESAAGTGFRVQNICVSYSLGATAAGTVITTTVSRRTTASTGGTALTNEAASTTAVTKHDPAGVNYTGLARGMAATLGTAGATLDQWQFPQTVIAGTTGITPISIVCKDYGSNGTQLLVAPAGVTNGIAVNVSAGGAGSLAVGSISMTFIQE